KAALRHLAREACRAKLFAEHLLDHASRNVPRPEAAYACVATDARIGAIELALDLGGGHLDLQTLADRGKIFEDDTLGMHARQRPAGTRRDPRLLCASG